MLYLIHHHILISRISQILTEWIVSQLSLRQVAGTDAQIFSSPPEELKVLSLITWQASPILVKASGLKPSLQAPLPLSSAEPRTTDYLPVPWPSGRTFRICFSHTGIYKGHRNEVTPWRFKLADPSLLQNMDTALPDTRTDNNSCMSPPSPAFSLDSSSPFANGLHYESILFEDKEEDKVTGPRSSPVKPCSSLIHDIATSSTNPKQKFTILDRRRSLSKSKRSAKACMSVKQDENYEKESEGNCDPASLECLRDDATTASSHLTFLLLCSY